jgi:S1-C subfamily serine protease
VTNQFTRLSLGFQKGTMVSTLLQQINADAAALNARVLNSLVQINNGQRGVGAGAIWRSDGLIMTNAHVILGRRGQVSSHLSVTLRDGRDLPVRFLAYDTALDLAALQIDARDLPAIEIGDSRHLNAGDLVFALGFPWGVKGGATTGVVIGSGAELPEIGDSKREWVAASLHLRPGHSGGPMVDSTGKVIGINTMMNGPEVGIAIPAHVAEAFLRAVAAQPHQPVSPPTDATIVKL